jgi:hypothetical protein
MHWLDKLLNRSQLARLVSLYFDAGWPFAGHLFESGSNDPDQFGRDDLLAVTFLNVVVPPKAGCSSTLTARPTGCFGGFVQVERFGR